MTETEVLRRELDQIQQRYLTSMHEGFMRDLRLAELAKEQRFELADLTKKVTLVTEGVNALLDRMNDTEARWRELSMRMDQTDKRWNDLIVLRSLRASRLWKSWKSRRFR